MKTLVLPLDLHDDAAVAIAVATSIAERAHAEVVFMTATTKTDKTKGFARLTALAQNITTVPTRVDVVATDRPVAEAVLAIAHLAPEGVICMSTHGRGSLGTAVMGSTAAEVLAATTDPVILCGPGVRAARFPANPLLLVPLDGSEAAEAICPLAIEMAKQLEITPTLLRVAHPYSGEKARHSDEALERALKTFADAGFVPNVEVIISSNTPTTIVGYAQTIGASLIAMNTHLRTGLARVMLGDVTMATVHAASCPVLVQHPT